MQVKIKRLSHSEGLPLPGYQSSGAAGIDLVAAVPAESPKILPPGGRALIPTGLILEIPAGFEAQVRPRSGMALNDGVTVLNSPGTIDCDYRGEIGVILINHGRDAYEIVRGARIAQLVFAPAPQAQLLLAETVDESARGDGGFGSTGQGSLASEIISASTL